MIEDDRGSGALMDIILHLALSIRQPWAHALAMGWKNVENRDWRKPNPGLNFRGPVAIHASSGMTQDEYWGAASAFRRCGFTIPPAQTLVRGAIIGVAEIVDIVKASDSPWFFGPKGLVIANARMLDEPIPCRGMLGFFEWKPSGEACAPLAKWMLPKQPDPQPRMF